MTSQLQVGSPAPALPVNPHGHPRVLAFVRDWAPDREPPEELATVRRRVRDLDAELIVLSTAGAWSFSRACDGAFCDRLAAEVATAALLYGVDGEGDAVFVIDGRGVVRFAHRPDVPLAVTLAAVLDAAGEAHQARDRLTRLERVLFTRREWALTCLVLGATLALGGVPEAPAPAVRSADARDVVVEKVGERLGRTRFARGTGPVRVCGASSSRGSTTASAAIVPLLSPVSRERTGPIEPDPHKPPPPATSSQRRQRST